MKCNVITNKIENKYQFPDQLTKFRIYFQQNATYSHTTCMDSHSPLSHLSALGSNQLNLIKINRTQNNAVHSSNFQAHLKEKKKKMLMQLKSNTAYEAENLYFKVCMD